MKKGLDELEEKVEKLESELGEMDTKQETAVKEINNYTNTIRDQIVTNVQEKITVVDDGVKDRLKELEDQMSSMDKSREEGNSQLYLTLNQTVQKMEVERQQATEEMDKELEKKVSSLSIGVKEISKYCSIKLCCNCACCVGIITTTSSIYILKPI